MEIEYKVFADHALAVFQKVLLAFTSHAGNLFAPELHFPDFPLIGQSHQADK